MRSLRLARALRGVRVVRLFRRLGRHARALGRLAVSAPFISGCMVSGSGLPLSLPGGLCVRLQCLLKTFPLS